MTDENGEDIPITVREANDEPKRARLEESAERAIEGFDTGVVDLLSWLLETETRARIYVHLRSAPHNTSEEIASGTGLYPSTVRETVAEMYDDGIVDRRKRDREGAGNKPYEYQAIPPSELVRTMLEQLQSQLNTVFQLDRYLEEDEPRAETEPIRITIDDDDETENR